MRDNHEGMIELVDAFEKDGHYFARIEKASRRFQFGVSREGYRVSYAKGNTTSSFRHDARASIPVLLCQFSTSGNRNGELLDGSTY